jgi:hypothetical protein
LFNSIGNKLCDPGWEQGQEIKKEMKRGTVKVTKSEQQKKQGDKKGCC